MCFTWDSWNSCTDFLLFFFPHRAPSTDFQGLQCLQVIALHFFFYHNNYNYNYESAVANQSSHPLSCLCSQDAQEVYRSCTDRLNQTDPRSKTKTKKQKEGKKKKNPPFFFLWRIWGRDLITTAGVCRHWNNNNNKTHAHTHIHTEKKKRIPGDKWIYRANDKTWGGITDRWKDGGCAANRQNAPVQSRAHLWEQEFVLLHFSRVASPVDLQEKEKKKRKGKEEEEEKEEGGGR